jgi:hypothetical protein
MSSSADASVGEEIQFIVMAAFQKDNKVWKDPSASVNPGM